LITVNHEALVSVNVVFATAAFAVAATMLLGQHMFGKWLHRHSVLAVLAVNGTAIIATWRVLDASWELLIPLCLGLLLTIAASSFLKDLSFTGVLVAATQTQVYLAYLFCALSLVTTSEVSTLTRMVMCAVFVVGSVYFLIALVQRLEQMEFLCRLSWRRRPRALRSTPTRSHYPKVSVHVPVCSEPPDMVMATLDALAKLDYPDYEVLVIDNNTRDPMLWQPVELHCRGLGERFRFFHVDRLSGAKAGALNLALRHTAPDSVLIGVVDSDYVTRPDFILSMVGYFDDERTGFVQTPHAYRDWEGDPYLTMCNWEYTPDLISTFVSRNERVAALMLGTMGMIRRRLLEDVGGWAEWSVTEDSEIALRVHAHGYSSVYIDTVLGRGLIPETFRAYQKQRFRWSYGAIQEIRRHFRLFLPKPLGRTSSLNTPQKLSHLMHAADYLKSGVEFLMLLLGATLLALLLVQGETIPVPPYIWSVLAIAVTVFVSLRWHFFHMLGFATRDILGAIAAHAALDHTIAMATLAGLLTRHTAWRRTNKFRAAPAGLAALGAVAPELLLGGTTSAMSIALLLSGHAQGLLLLLAFGGLLKSAKYLLAPFMAVLAEHSIRQRANYGCARDGISVQRPKESKCRAS
jgi:cellulose synthase/poly-beta-1,6-N-acetylglucosamine synthase-like glycosyltransferase